MAERANQLPEWQNTVSDRVRSTAAGLDVDGYVAQLEGEPPRAVSHGWGDMRFLTTPARQAP